MPQKQPYVYQLDITLNDPLYFATRELGRQYQTGEYLHNYALTYAFGLAVSEYHHAVQIPRYQEQLEPLASEGLYITPARPERVGFNTQTFKWADTRSHVKMQQSSLNIPTYGRIREVATESSFTAFAIAQKPREWPRWIRLGKWMSKAAVSVSLLEATAQTGPFVTRHPLNPLDTRLQAAVYDLVNMPPVSIIQNARFEGEFLRLDNAENARDQTCLPADLAYRFA